MARSRTTASYEFRYFDELGEVHVKTGRIAKTEWVYCSDPVRFVGGGCGRFFSCTRAKTRKCAASPTREAAAMKEGINGQ
jgi:hypothetical protein